MKQLIPFLSLLFLLSCTASKNTKSSTDTSPVTDPVNSVSDEEQVREAFDKYKSAILNDRGNEAVNYVDSRTLEYYSDILNQSISGDSATVDNLGIMDKLMVFSIRHRTSKEDILSFDGRQLLEYAIKEGMVGKNSVANNEIGEIKIENTFATGQLVSGGRPAPMYFHFYKEQNAWKIDLTSIFPVASMAFQRMADDSGQEENEYLFMLLEMITGKSPDRDIWQPIK